ncbi:hypothetical protein KY310_02120 [Candidatus Woesearchaeota archaeon]|nr:hypothetical protein [Candidatus Woesearchaeota archaeon]
MDLEKSFPMTLLAVVAVLAVVGMVMLYNTGTTGLVVRKSTMYGRAIATPETVEQAKKEKGVFTAWGSAIAGVKPRQSCFVLTVQGQQYDLTDVPAYISMDDINNLQKCYPYFSVEDLYTDKYCCVGI